MKYNTFGEPKPANLDELEEAFREIDCVIEDVSVMIDFNEDDGEFHGFTAEIIDHDQDKTFSTLGYESKDQLISDLIAAGVGHRQINEY
jgi:hypothetical protein